MSEESLESWPSLIQASTSVVLNAEDSNIRFLLWASFAEIYNEQIFDLLDSVAVSTSRAARPSNLHLRDGDGRPYIRGLREVQVSSAEEAWRLVQIGRENQHIASTRLNRASSRSHSIFTLRLIQVVDVDQPSVARIASLSFCDLAGSERSTASGGCNERIKEAGNINLSLMTLGRCIEALRKNQARADQSSAARASIIVPFRNSRLTRMFQSFLCGEGRVVMITNVSPCANVFDETLHAVNYSALASQVVVGPSGPPATQSTSILIIPTEGVKRKTSLLGKHEGAAAASKVVVEKKLKCDATIPEEEDEYVDASSEDVPDLSKDDREKKLLSAITLLQNELDEERQKKNAIRAEVCEEMQRQLVKIENDFHESNRRAEEILESKYDRKMEIYMEAVKKSCKRQRRGDDEDDYIPSVELHAAEVKLSKYATEVDQFKNEIAKISKELATARENIGKVSAERDAVAEKLTKAEFSTGEAVRQEKAQARAECAKLRSTVEELTNKLNEAEHRNEVSCRQLRRDKAELEQRLKAAEMQATNQNLEDETDKSALNSQTASVAELEAALKKDGDTIHDLEQRLKAAEEDTKAVEKTWADHCKGVEAVCQQQSYDLTKLREKYDALERSVQETVKISDAAKQNDAQLETLLQTARSELADTETRLKEVTAVSESLREEINSLTVESEKTRKNLAEKEAKYEKLEAEIEDLKQQACTAAGSSQNKVSAIERDLTAMQEKLKQQEDEKAAMADSLTSELEKRSAQLVECKNELSAKASEILRLEKELEAERGSRSRLQDTAADYEKKLEQLRSEVLQEKEKYSTLRSSFESLQGELNVTKDAYRAAEDENAGHLSSIISHEAKVEKAKEELDIMKNRLQQCNDNEKTLQQQLTTSSELINKLQEKDKNNAVELAARDKKIQACQVAIGDLMRKSEEERLKFESALKDAHSNDKVVEQMKLTITEQEMTMQTQDQTLRERDVQVQSLEEKLENMTADHQQQLESLNDQIHQKNARIRELGKEVETVGKSRECLEKDVRDVTSELKTSERNLSEVTKELNKVKHELDKLKPHETDIKALVKEIYQKNFKLSDLQKQLEAAQDKLEKDNQEMEKLSIQFRTLKAEKEKDLTKWREDRDRLVAKLERLVSEKEAEIRHLKEELKTGRSKADKSEDLDRRVESLQKTVDQLTRVASVKEETIADMREQNLQLQHQISQLQQQTDAGNGDDNPRRRNAPRKSRIPTSQRVPLRVTDGNADISVGVLADGGIAVDLDEMVGAPKRNTRKCHASHENVQPKTSDVIEEQVTRATRTRRKRTTSTMDTAESTIVQEPEGVPQTRRLRSRHC